MDQPIICNLVKQYDLEFNILKARVTPREEGLLVLELKGEERTFAEGLEYLDKIGVTRQWLSQDVVRDDARCFQCGVCTSVCPSGALTIVRDTMCVDFEDKKCVACGLCVGACPVRAMTVSF